MHVQGTVTNLNGGLPIANQAVYIHNDSTSPNYFNHTVYTWTNGFYVDTIPMPAGATGNLYVGTVDCQNYLQQQWFTYGTSPWNYVANFAICYNSNPCQASFTYSQTQPLTVSFFDGSVGGNNIRNWSFGDGSTSSQANPVHSYAQAGTYTVTLTIGALGTTCYNSMTMVIQVWGNTTGCVAAFYTIKDSTNSNLIYFVNTSTGNGTLSWFWDFGDGQSSTLENPSHVYATAGSYNACLTIHSNDTTCYNTTCHTVVTGTPTGCHAGFAIYADTMNSLNTYHFIDQSTGTQISTYIWNFGDGTVQTITFPQSPNVVHTYAQAGNYMVCLSIQGANNCNDTKCDTLSVGGMVSCHAEFTYYSDSSNTIGYAVNFIDQSTTSTGTITSWFWNFGDPASGSNGTSTSQNPTHVFTTAGNYNVCLHIASSDSSCTDWTCHVVVVNPNPGCQAYFSYSVNPAPGNYTATFTDLSSGNPTAWQWSFGDGSSSSLQNPVHAFAAPGSYPVTLTIFGANCQSTFTKTVNILDSTNYHMVYGQVFAGDFPINTGMAMIFSVDTTANYQPFVEVAPIDSMGIYYFTLVPAGNYYIMAIPFAPAGYLPTYYGNTISWQSATVVSLGTAANPYNINLEACGQMLPGQGSASGQVNMGDVSNAMLDKINMIIMNDQEKAIGFAQLSTTGAFSFPSLAYGTYWLRPEMPGVTSETIMIVLSADKPHAEVVMTFTGKSILGVGEKDALVNAWSVYPNPVVDKVNVDINLKSSTTAIAEVYNFANQLIFTQELQLTSGANRFSMPISTLSSGVYMLRIYSASGINLNTKLVKTR